MKFIAWIYIPNDHQSTGYEYPTHKSTAQSNTSGAIYGFVPDIDVANLPSSITVAILKSVMCAWPVKHKKIKRN